MRHQRSGKKLGRDSAHRKALYANLTASMITLGRDGSIHARRRALAYLRTQEIVHKLFSEVGPRFAGRPGGYTRIVKLGPRQGDAAPMAYLELVDFVPDTGRAEDEGSRSRRRREPEQVEAPAS